MGKVHEHLFTKDFMEFKKMVFGYERSSNGLYPISQLSYGSFILGQAKLDSDRIRKNLVIYWRAIHFPKGPH